MPFLKILRAKYDVPVPNYMRAAQRDMAARKAWGSKGKIPAVPVSKAAKIIIDDSKRSPAGEKGRASSLLDRIGGGENFEQQKRRAQMEDLDLIENNIAVIKAEYEKAEKLCARILELSCRDKSSVARRIAALKVAITCSGMKRAGEINSFIERGNAMAASAIMYRTMRALKQMERGLFSRYYPVLREIRGKSKFRIEPDGRIKVFMGRYVMVQDTTIVEQKPQTFTLYRWQRILDRIFASQAENRRKMAEMKNELGEMAGVLISENMGNERLQILKGRLTGLAEKLKGVKEAKLRHLRREVEEAAQFIDSPNWSNMTRSSLRNARDCAAARIADIDSEFAYLEYLRAELRGIGEERLGELGDLSLKIQSAVKAGNFRAAGGRAEKILQLPRFVRSEPEFRSAITTALRIVQNAFYLAAKDSIGAAKKETLKKALNEDIEILSDIAREGLLCSRFMSAYQPLVNNMHMGKITALKSDEEAFNKAFSDWFAVNRAKTPRGERYWRAQLYRAVFISERSPCFDATGILLLILKIKDIEKLRPYLENNCLAIARFLTDIKFDHASLIPEDSRDAFLKNLCAAAVKDFNLNAAPAEELAHFYRAFGVSAS